MKATIYIHEESRFGYILVLVSKVSDMALESLVIFAPRFFINRKLNTEPLLTRKENVTL